MLALSSFLTEAEHARKVMDMKFLSYNDNAIRFAVGLIVILSFSSAPHSSAEEEVAKPIIEFDAEEKDLGTVSEGDEKKFEFLVKNTGNATLEVTRLRSMCDCVEVTMDVKIIEPGESAPIEGVFDSVGRWGEQEKLIVVYSNASNATQSPLKVKLMVEAGIRVTPRSFSFGEIARKKSLTHKVKIEARLEEELKIKKMTVLPSDVVKAKVLKRKTTSIDLPSKKKGYLTEIDVELKATNKSAGEFSGQLEIETSFKDKPMISVLFSGDNVGDLEVTPQMVQFRNAVPGKSVAGYAVVKSLHKGDFNVKGLDAKGLPIALGTLSKKAAKEQRVELLFISPKKPKRFYRGYVYILTDHPTQKRIKVGINAITAQPDPG